MYQKLIWVSHSAKVGSGWKHSTVHLFHSQLVRMCMCSHHLYIRVEAIRQYCKWLQNRIWVMSIIKCCAISECWIIWLVYYLFKLIAERERGVLGELGWLLTRERAVHCAVNLGQVGNIFSSVSISVNFYNCKVNQKLKSCATPGWRDAPDEEDLKKWNREIDQEYVCLPGFYVYIDSRAKLSQDETRKTCVCCTINWLRCK